MNSAQFHKISINYMLWNALETLRHRHYNEWDSLTKKELMGLVMQESRGHLNPQMIMDMIEEL